ncbi:hypothetical protein M3215_17490 [Bacillus cytotoxicus]|uniref:Uncharacterized protein n=1 Tax=Bacillus cytotoxicus TaxID=580165 RepID=A0ACC6A9N6_9BACI|nr:hypothetical protein [Bacillus cytotoxicus]
MIYKRKRLNFQVLLVSICLLFAMFIASGALYTQSILKGFLKQEQPHNTEGWKVPEPPKKKGEMIPPEKGTRSQTISNDGKKDGWMRMQQEDSEGKKRFTST